MSTIEILVPDLPESVTDATVVNWYKKVGDYIQRDEILVEIETDKVILEVPSPNSGVLESILEEEGKIVISRQLLGRICIDEKNIQDILTPNEKDEKNVNVVVSSTKEEINEIYSALSPSARRHKQFKDIGPLPTDTMSSIIEENQSQTFSHQETISQKEPQHVVKISSSSDPNRNVHRISMNRFRKRIAERLLHAKNNMAMLTTFNEVNMQPIINFRKKYGDMFEKRHNIRLGFMSFYVKAVMEALRRYPDVNAAIDMDKEEIIYYEYFDISIAVSTNRGLVTPVLRNVESLNFATIEKKIKDLALKSREGTLKVEEIIGGNFTITNGGVFGSLMSTPIINPPQTAILGMHAIVDRPVAVDGQIVICPMMYLALSYDHRLIDGKESVSFLLTIKEILEDPIRLLLEV
ncbi:dihydrolipoyllysine-residue succinyltransferase [Candidatus Schneideria nysicola]|uniref:dihydrolipoyllysine-residue succinyltransferase n=1 Tax=Candidatus Schneideria nysicola TaxID=1081631 RepID=UPI001CAA7009|nr:dihydrolipoyllysine-residue succinyltransferase [Candidatus Schneideria nysicola]UAJ65619.1 dihydrolipoyllysine-residue succinyltransferase [Candidatus Schneideria nysicola]